MVFWLQNRRNGHGSSKRDPLRTPRVFATAVWLVINAPVGRTAPLWALMGVVEAPRLHVPWLSFYRAVLSYKVMAPCDLFKRHKMCCNLDCTFLNFLRSDCTFRGYAPFNLLLTSVLLFFKKLWFNKNYFFNHNFLENIRTLLGTKFKIENI